MYIPITPSCSHKHTSADHRYRAWCGLTRLIGGEKKKSHDSQCKVFAGSLRCNKTASRVTAKAKLWSLLCKESIYVFFMQVSPCSALRAPDGGVTA